ncbi:SH3 domain-containing protein, partial [Aeromonas enteropelogenes]
MNVRAEPSLQANVIQKLTYGQEVRIVGETTDWYQININGAATGWVYRTYIMTASYSIQVLEDGTNVRTAPSL